MFADSDCYVAFQVKTPDFDGTNASLAAMRVTRKETPFLFTTQLGAGFNVKPLKR